MSVSEFMTIIESNVVILEQSFNPLLTSLGTHELTSYNILPFSSFNPPLHHIKQCGQYYHRHTHPGKDVTYIGINGFLF